MGFMGLLKFALLCVNFLAWPVIALGYPLFASVRAIETGSKYHMRKLVIYWTLFSLISLFEYAFVKILEWIPFWYSIKLVVIFWLAVPRFHGAIYVYQSFIHPCLVVNIQEVIRKLEEQSRAKETFIDVADKYIKDNGLEALEKLITTKREHKESDDSQKDTEDLESDKKIAGATLELLKESDAAQRDNETLEARDKSGNAVGAQAQPVTTSEVTKETTYAAALTKGIPNLPTQTILIPENKNNAPPTPTPLVNKVEPVNWTCSLCQVTTSSENNLNDHLRGKKHKSMCESLKAIKLNAQDQKTRPSSNQKSCKKAEEGSGATPTHHLCFLCNVKLVGDASLASHLKGKRHMSNVETKWGKVGT